MAYAPGNAKLKTLKLTFRNKGVKILTPSKNGNINSGTNAGTGSLIAVLLAY